MQDREEVQGRAEGVYVAAHTFEEHEGAKGAASALCAPVGSLKDLEFVDTKNA